VITYILRKVSWYLLTLVLAVVINFTLPRLIKGNPVDSIVSQMSRGMMDSDVRKQLFATFNQEFGLDQPLPRQFIVYLHKLLHGDLGTHNLQSIFPWQSCVMKGIMSSWVAFFEPHFVRRRWTISKY
jgi:ABC-type dipeptide/oligopeptide/nickel transport system permease component